LREAGYPPALHIPREDVEIRHFAPSARETTCPGKGQTNPFSLRDGGGSNANVVWSYGRPEPVVAAMKDDLAFDQSRVEIVGA